MVNRKDLDPEESPAAEFGVLLRRLRDERGWTQEDLGARMRVSGTHISAVETNRRPPTPQFARSADRALGTGDLLARKVRAVRNTSLLEGFPEFVKQEMAATEIMLFELGIIPGLLQTSEYAEAVTQGAVSRGAISEQQADERLTLLAKRQAALLREPTPFMYVVLDESCIRRLVGGPTVLAAQMDRLLEVASLPSVVMQVAPYDLGERRSFDLPVTLLTTRERTILAYAESAQQGLLERDCNAVRPLLTAYHQLQAEALSQAASKAMIEHVRKGIS
ncbi:Scr1 family TA system antitoxin-like transcriptional regulator [Streptomyces albidoflavus]